MKKQAKEESGERKGKDEKGIARRDGTTEEG